MNTPGLALNVSEIQEQLEQYGINGVRLEKGRIYMNVPWTMTEEMSTAIDAALESYQPVDFSELIITYFSPLDISENQKNELQESFRSRVHTITEGSVFSGKIEDIVVRWNRATAFMRGYDIDARGQQGVIFVDGSNHIDDSSRKNLRSTLSREFRLPITIKDVRPTRGGSKKK